MIVNINVLNRGIVLYNDAKVIITARNMKIACIMPAQSSCNEIF